MHAHARTETAERFSGVAGFRPLDDMFALVEVDRLKLTLWGLDASIDPPHIAGRLGRSARYFGNRDHV